MASTGICIVKNFSCLRAEVYNLKGSNVSIFISSLVWLFKIHIFWKWVFSAAIWTGEKMKDSKWNLVEKIFKNLKFYFFRIEQKLNDNKLQDLKNLRKIVFIALNAIFRGDACFDLKKFENCTIHAERDFI